MFIKRDEYFEKVVRALPVKISLKNWTLIESKSKIVEISTPPYLASESDSFVMDTTTWNERSNFKEMSVEMVNADLMRESIRKNKESSFLEKYKAFYIGIIESQSKFIDLFE